MDKLSNLALLAQMLESAEKNIQSAKQLVKEVMGGKAPVNSVSEKAQVLNTVKMEGARIIEGVFDGQNMIGPDGKKYPVPANYASKSKLIEGDVLKLTISEDGSFIYKQIGPVERVKKLGTLTQEDNGEYKVIAEGKTYKVLLASLTYFKATAGDEVTIIVPEEQDSEWAAVENVIKNPGSDGGEDQEDGEMDDQPVAEEEELSLDDDLGMEEENEENAE